uniref:hypothetical protein n=1 Tax=Cupriavidus yeoncheonensis TaxID=1462994 RepID=UPI003F497291
MDFISRIGEVVVEKHEIPRKIGGYLSVAESGIGVLHTTESNTIAGTLETFEKHNDPPHFLVGERKIVQCRPLGVRAGALRSNHGDTANLNAQVQIEMLSFSQKTPWLPAEETLKGVVLVIAYCAKHLGIPLQSPNEEWLDDCSDMPKPWAAENSRRVAAKQGLWPMSKGWWMHLEVPWQNPTWHWDCGALRRQDLLILANTALSSV